MELKLINKVNDKGEYQLVLIDANGKETIITVTNVYGLDDLYLSGQVETM